MVVKGEAIVVILDVGASMHCDSMHCDPTPLEESKKIISRIIHRKIFSRSKDEIALVLCGYADGFEKDVRYSNICIAQDLQCASWKLIELLNVIEGSDMVTDSLRHYALDTAIGLFQNSEKANKICSRKILFFTNFDGNFKSPGINTLFDMLRKYQIETNFIDVLSTLTNYEMKTYDPCRTNLLLDIGKLCIPISIFIKVRGNYPRRWFTGGYVHDPHRWTRRRVTFCMEDKSQTKVSYEDTFQAYKYGTTVVPCSLVDKNMDYQSGEKGMTVLGFTKAEKIPRYLYTDYKSRYVFGEKASEKYSGRLLAAFIQSLHDLNMVAIVRFVCTNRSAPVMGFLSPRIKENYECLVFIALPFLEDLRYFKFTPLDSDSKNVPTEQQLNAVDELISAMDMTAFDDDDDDGEILKPKNTVNPYMQRLFQCLEYRAHNPGKPLPDIPPHIQALINPVPKLLNRAKRSVKKIKSLFPLKECVPKKLNGSKFQPFSDRYSINSSYVDMPIKIEPSYEDVPEEFDDIDPKLLEAMGNITTQVGKINPVKDIQYLINNHKLPFNKICEQINDVLRQLLLQDRDHMRFHFPKILSVFREYRALSLKANDCLKYNVFLISLQRDLLKTNDELWDKIRSEKIALISEEELPTSTVTSESAERFLSKQCLTESARGFAVVGQRRRRFRKKGERRQRFRRRRRKKVH